MISSTAIFSGCCFSRFQTRTFGTFSIFHVKLYSQMLDEIIRFCIGTSHNTHRSLSLTTSGLEPTDMIPLLPLYRKIKNMSMISKISRKSSVFTFFSRFLLESVTSLLTHSRQLFCLLYKAKAVSRST